MRSKEGPWGKMREQAKGPRISARFRILAPFSETVFSLIILEEDFGVPDTPLCVMK